MIEIIKTAREIGAIVDEVQHILYNNDGANYVEIRISCGAGSLPLISYEVKDKAVISK